MDQMTDEELETVQNILGENTWMTGFYSYGELAPYSKSGLDVELQRARGADAPAQCIVALCCTVSEPRKAAPRSPEMLKHL